MLVLLGIDEYVAACMVICARNEGKYIAKVLNNGNYRTYTIHHGMIGNITHTYSIEIS